MDTVIDMGSAKGYLNLVVLGTVVELALLTGIHNSTQDDICRTTHVDCGTHKCQCGYQSLRCAHDKNLTEIPHDLNVYTLKMQSICITKGTIYVLSADAFASYRDLRAIRLNNLELRSIHELTFSQLYNLTYLNLDHNELTSFDPSGRMFSYLSSLQTLSLISNNISAINHKSFVTMRPSSPISIDLSDNPTGCECDMYALYKWNATLTRPVIKIVGGFSCWDYLKMTLHDKMSIDVHYDDCHETVTNATCPSCIAFPTAYECDKMPRAVCGPDQACLQQIKSRNHSGMSIYSRCAPIDECAALSQRNPKECTYSSQKKGHLICSYCCVDCNGRFDIARKNEMAFTVDFYLEDKEHVQNLTKIALETKLLMSALDTDTGSMYLRILHYGTLANQTQTITALVVVNDFDWILVKNDPGSYDRALDESVIRHRHGRVAKYTINETVSRDTQCKSNVTEMNGDVKVWPEVYARDEVHRPCADTGLFDKTHYVSRYCKTGPRDPQWGDLDTTRCPSVAKFNNTATPFQNTDVVHRSSISMLTFLESKESLDLNETKVVMLHFERLLGTKGDLVHSDTWMYVMKMIVRLIDIVPVLDHEGKYTDSTSTKNIASTLRTMIDHALTNVNLTDGPFEYSSQNFGATVRQLKAKETRKAVYSEDRFVDGIMQMKVRLEREISHPPVGIVVPPAHSLMSNPKASFTRVIFTVYHNWKLFGIPKESWEGSLARFDALDDNKEDNNNNNDDYKSSRRTMRQVLVSSKILSVSMPGINTDRLKDGNTILITFNRIPIPGNTSANLEPRCSYWDPTLMHGRGAWRGHGCKVSHSDKETLTCSCNHMTNFALLMDGNKRTSDIQDAHKTALSIISRVGCAVSLLALVITLVTYTAFRKLRQDNPSKILINLCICIAVTNTIFLCGLHDYTFRHKLACQGVAVLLHYFLLASLVWMAIEAFYLYLGLVWVFQRTSSFVARASVVGWGYPIFVVTGNAAIDLNANYGFLETKICWIKKPSFYVTFLVPTTIIVAFNYLIFARVLVVLLKLKDSRSSVAKFNEHVNRLRGTAGLCTLLGLSWAFGIFVMHTGSLVFHYLFAICNTLQGLFVFIFYCLLKEDVREAWTKYFYNRKQRGTTGFPDVSRSTFTTGRQSFFNTPRPSANAESDEI